MTCTFLNWSEDAAAVETAVSNRRSLVSDMKQLNNVPRRETFLLSSKKEKQKVDKNFLPLEIFKDNDEIHALRNNVWQL